MGCLANVIAMYTVADVIAMYWADVIAICYVVDGISTVEMICYIIMLLPLFCGRW